jgi:hypothetical protein
LDLYLHIGTEKTGTTSLQQFLRKNRDVLAENGILYPSSPGTGNHTALAVIALDDSRRGPLRRMVGVTTVEELQEFRAKFQRDLAAELAGGTYRKVIMSNEHCSTRLNSDHELEYLRDIFRSHFDNIYVVVYIRRQDDYLLSSYSTHVKNGATDAASLPEDEKEMARYDHWQLLSRWARVFGRERIICRKYERASLVGGSIEDDLLTAIGIDLNLGLEKQPQFNESLDASALEFLRLLNKYTSFEERPPGLIALLAGISDGPRTSLSPEAIGGFMEQHRESNRRVAEEYFGGALAGPGDPLFAPVPDSRGRTHEEVLSPERAVQIAACLWRSKADEFRQRNPGQLRKFQKPDRQKLRQERKDRARNEE